MFENFFPSFSVFAIPRRTTHPIRSSVSPPLFTHSSWSIPFQARRFSQQTRCLPVSANTCVPSFCTEFAQKSAFNCLPKLEPSPSSNSLSSKIVKKKFRPVCVGFFGFAKNSIFSSIAAYISSCKRNAEPPLNIVFIFLFFLCF